MNIRNLIVAIIALGFAAGAGVANAQSGSTAANAAATRRPIQVFQLLSGPTWVYYKNRNHYHSLAYTSHVKIFNRFTAVSFINSGSQPIQKITFELAAYSDVYRPVVGANGQPVIKRLVANGPFALGAKRTLVNANVVWSIPPGNGLGCVRLSGMQIVFVDGSSVNAAADGIRQYLAPGLSNHCGIPPRNREMHNRWVGPTPYIAGVYPAQWMVMREYQRLYRQPYVPPGDRQSLCAVGSLVEESCETTSADGAY